jgi:hypothetical protein
VLAANALPREATPDEVDGAAAILSKVHTAASDTDVRAFERGAASVLRDVREAVETRLAWDRERADALEGLRSRLREAGPDDVDRAERALGGLLEQHRRDGRPGHRFRAACEGLIDGVRKTIAERESREDWAAARGTFESLAGRRLPERATTTEIEAATRALRESSMVAEQRGLMCRSFMAGDAVRIVGEHVRVVERRCAVEDALERPGVTPGNRDRLRRVAEAAANGYTSPSVAGAEARDAVARALDERRRDS